MTAAAGNVADLVSAAARERPEAVAFVDTATEVALTWSEADGAVDAQARRLVAAGVVPGDRVVMRLPTSIGFAVTFFAVARAGGIAVPVAPQLPDGELRSVLDHSGATLVVGGTPDDLGEGRRVLDPALDDALGLRAEPLPATGGGEDIAAVLYTSGTSGSSRGVMLSHRALVANVAQLRAIDPAWIGNSDRVLVAIPLSHSYGLGPGLLHTIAAGATIVLSPRFDAHAALANCAKHRVTVVLGVPTMYAELASRSPEAVRASLQTVKLLLSGAAQLHPKVLAAVRDASGLEVYEGYGLSEAGPVVTSTLVSGYPKPGSVGRPLPGVELLLVDSDGTAEPVPLDPADPDDAFGDEGGTGLVALRGDNLFSGYWPDGAQGPDADGWYRTGDVGFIDADGDLHLVDRATDLIIVNGFNVYPHEVEAAIATLPEVADVAVVGALDDRTGESVKAVVVPVAGAALSEQQVVDVCAERLAAYKVPRTVEFAERLPHTVTGKLRRSDLRG